MTDNEIVKALECCVNGERGNKCRGCEVATGCKSLLLRESLDLIKSQKAEIESMENCERILICQLAEERDKAIKEFAERLKETKFKHGSDYFVYAENIDNLVKEMTEETK